MEGRKGAASLTKLPVSAYESPKLNMAVKVLARRTTANAPGRSRHGRRRRNRPI
jgi:hypothetical protein